MTADPQSPSVEPRRLGRYTLFDEIASGGMATVHFGRLLGPAGFSRTVAIKRLHTQFAKSPDFVTMFLDEARLAARIRHPNVVSTLDVVARDGELFLVMEYVQGESLARLLRASSALGIAPRPNLVSAIIVQVLLGLHAAHEATSEQGECLNIVHRDVSPQNVLVGVEGIARVLDFGVAKASSRLQTTEDGALKGKVPYMSPEQLLRGPVDKRTDIFAASVILWEALTCRRLFAADDVGSTITHILHGKIELPSKFVSELGPEVDAVVMRGLARDPNERFSTGREMAQALEAALPPISALKVGDWVESVARAALQGRANVVARIEETSEHQLRPTKETVGALLASTDRDSLHLGPDAGDSRGHRASAETLPRVATDELTARGVHIHMGSSPTWRTTFRARATTVGLTLAIACVVALFVRAQTKDAVLRLEAAPFVPYAAALGARAAATAPLAASAPPALVAPSPKAAPPLPSADPPRALAAAHPLTGKAPSRPRDASAAAAKAPRECDIPYVILENGTKRYKPQCF